MPVSITGYTLKQFFEDERLWTGHQAYEDVAFEFQGVPQGYADPLTIPDESQCLVSGGFYKAPHSPPQPFEPLLKSWLEKLEHVRVGGVVPRSLEAELRQWLSERGASGVSVTPCRLA